MSLVYNWLWNCKCLIAYTFRGSLLGFCFSLLLLSLLTNKNSHWAFEFEFDWNAEKAARAQQQNDHTKKWVIFFPKKNEFFSLLENHSNWILPLFAHLTLCFFYSCSGTFIRFVNCQQRYVANQFPIWMLQYWLNAWTSIAMTCMI